MSSGFRNRYHNDYHNRYYDNRNHNHNDINNRNNNYDDNAGYRYNNERNEHSYRYNNDNNSRFNYRNHNNSNNYSYRRHDDDRRNNRYNGNRNEKDNNDDVKKRNTSRSRSRRSRSCSSRSGSDDSSCDDTVGHIDSQPGDKIHGRYTVVKQLGIGTFGKVLQCDDSKHGDCVAIKVIRKIEKYVESAEIESRILGTIYEQQKSKDKSTHLCVKLYSHFKLDGHYFMVFETLGKSLFDIIKENDYTGFDLSITKHITNQLLQAMDFLRSIKLIHTDLKLENILLVNDTVERIWNEKKKRYVNIPVDTRIKVIDFGGATFESEKHSVIINTRQYRGPEVTLELGWSYPSDIWSVGCMIAEMYTGDLLFATHDNLEHLCMMEKCSGRFPAWMISDSIGMQYFHSNGNPKTEKLSRSNRDNINSMQTLQEIFTKRNGDRESGIVDLTQKLLILDPYKRIVPKDALLHSFFNH